MNKVILIGRLTKEPDIRYTQGSNMLVARFSIAVDRKYKKQGEATADFINCIAFGKNGEFVEKYLTKGTKVVVEGRIQTGSYTNKEGNKVYTTDIIAESFEFAESKAAASQNNTSSDGGNPFARPTLANPEVQKNQQNPFAVPTTPAPNNEEFYKVPEGITEEEFPFM